MFQAKGSSLDRCRSVAQKRRLVIQSLEDRRLLNADTPSNAASALQDGFAKGVVSGYVFQDRNGNGEQDLGDVGIPGERVFQDLNQNGLLDAGEPSQLTASDGSFQFADLQVDRYVFGLLRHIDKVSTPHQTQFSKATRISTGEGTNSVAIANLDGDSTLDLIATNGGDNSLYVGLQFASSEATTNMAAERIAGAQGRLAPACKQLKRGMQDAGKSIEAAGKTASSSLKSFSKLAEAAANVLNKWFFIFSVSWTMVLVIALLFVDGVPSFFKNFVTLFATSCLGLAFFALIGCFGCVTFALIDPKACEEFASSRLEAFRALNLFLAKL